MNEQTIFYQRFLALCGTNGIKPTSVTNMIGISRTNATFWKKGSMPNAMNLKKIADLFSVPVEYLLGQETPKTMSKERYDALRTTGDIEEIRRMLDGLSPESVAALAEFVKFLYAKDNP